MNPSSPYVEVLERGLEDIEQGLEVADAPGAPSERVLAPTFQADKEYLESLLDLAQASPSGYQMFDRTLEILGFELRVLMSKDQEDLSTEDEKREAVVRAKIALLKKLRDKLKAPTVVPDVHDRTGRTTRMLEHAQALARHGRAVYVVCTSRHHAELLSRQTDPSLGIKFETWTTLRVDPFTLNTRGSWPQVEVLFDHAAIESTFARALSALHMYDLPETGADT